MTEKQNTASTDPKYSHMCHNRHAAKEFCCPAVLSLLSFAKDLSNTSDAKISIASTTECLENNEYIHHICQRHTHNTTICW